MEPPPHIAKLLEHLAQFNPELTTGEDAHSLWCERDTKLVKVLWPKHAREIFLDFTRSGELLLAESVEYYASETELEQGEDLACIVQNFLLHEVKVTESGRFLKRKELQSLRNGKWLSVFESAAQ